MPTYEYECSACRHRFEAFQSITAAPVRICPACKKRKVRRLIGRGGALIFKGSGFYATDYRSASYKAGAKKDVPAAPSACSGCKKDSTSCPQKKQG
jgi:putative FmdB family regulatory protein